MLNVYQEIKHKSFNYEGRLTLISYSYLVAWYNSLIDKDSIDFPWWCHDKNHGWLGESVSVQVYLNFYSGCGHVTTHTEYFLRTDITHVIEMRREEIVSGWCGKAVVSWNSTIQALFVWRRSIKKSHIPLINPFLASVFKFIVVFVTFVVASDQKCLKNFSN